MILISPTRLSPSMPESESDLTEKPRSLMRPRVEEEVLLTSLPALSTLYTLSSTACYSYLKAKSHNSTNLEVQQPRGSVCMETV